MSFADVSPLLVVAAILIYTTGGVAKGLAGLGLQSMTVPLMALVAPLDLAIAISILPAFVTSFWQAVAGGALRKVIRRIWTFMLPCCLTIFLGAEVLATVDRALLTGVLGLLLVAYALYALTRPQLPELGRREVWLSPTVGAITGVAAGATGTFVMPGAPYVQLLKLSRDELVQAIGIMAIVLQPILALALGRSGLLDEALGAASLALVVPTMAGLAVGTALRRWISEAAFKSVFTWTLLALGVVVVIRSLI